MPNSRYCSIMFNHLSQKRILLSNLLPKQNPQAAILGFLALEKYRGNPLIISCYIMLLYIIYHVYQHFDWPKPWFSKPSNCKTMVETCWFFSLRPQAGCCTSRPRASRHGNLAGPSVAWGCGVDAHHRRHCMTSALAFCDGGVGVGDMAWYDYGLWAMGGVVSSQFWGVYLLLTTLLMFFFGNFSRTDDGI